MILEVFADAVRTGGAAQEVQEMTRLYSHVLASPGLDPGVYEQLQLIRGWPGQARPKRQIYS